MLRGWPPPRSVCGASPLMTEFYLLQRGIRALGVVASIRLGAVQLLLGMSPCDPGQAIVEVVLGDGGVLGVSRRGTGWSKSGLPLDRALRDCRWRGSSRDAVLLFLDVNGMVVSPVPLCRFWKGAGFGHRIPVPGHLRA